MKATLVSLYPTSAAIELGRPALTPELLAASGARYSRNNEGLEAILSRIDPADPDRSVDSIFRMVDYGHQSIADMAPIAMFLDGVSIWLAFNIWSVCPTAGGQESSTRYIQLDPSGLPDPAAVEIPEAERGRWIERMNDSFRAYSHALRLWERLLERRPDLSGIPNSLLADQSEAALKKTARMRRNYAFDRARVHLPAAALTNVMLVMSARGWVALCQHLLSHPLAEPRTLGRLIQAELALVVPRLLRHARAVASFEKGLRDEFEAWQAAAAARVMSGQELFPSIEPEAFLEIMPPPELNGEAMAEGLRYHDNRYAWTGQALRRTAVRFGWNAVGFAEIRDLNRHRTGSKYCPLTPVGFYGALDQIPPDCLESLEAVELAAYAHQSAARARAAAERIASGDFTALYDLPLGTQLPFEHVTTLDKVIYEAELRTGAGAHYRYAAHLRDVLSLLYKKIPELRGCIIEGAAEPE